MFTVSILSVNHVSRGVTHVCMLLSSVCPQMIALLPEEWRPGETLLGCPWQAVLVTALVGVLTVTSFIWNSVLAVSIVTTLESFNTRL